MSETESAGGGEQELDEVMEEIEIEEVPDDGTTEDPGAGG